MSKKKNRKVKVNLTRSSRILELKSVDDILNERRKVRQQRMERLKKLREDFESL